jgi:hypothetical protein
MELMPLFLPINNDMMRFCGSDGNVDVGRAFRVRAEGDFKSASRRPIGRAPKWQGQWNETGAA